jgi:hypothetical protein
LRAGIRVIERLSNVRVAPAQRKPRYVRYASCGAANEPSRCELGQRAGRKNRDAPKGGCPYARLPCRRNARVAPEWKTLIAQHHAALPAEVVIQVAHGSAAAADDGLQGIGLRSLHSAAIIAAVQYRYNVQDE